ncbi:16S rRNA (guanine(966)-N(2))-methyltransferase RsmD [Bifidobacterium aemilianum]|uniref:16S rRNA (Guanine(966)-N(2))-methyltransferase RsmD n=1 Tax=Bifidobacterium aemilianum TaxID=2493120 RepID=A0A366KBC2_9BIFI|nr:16S rRNA (guanine(966)-N(2))-methyltransferase RsmD [Bifidobacterium aemilianum]RBP97951.1 16S rRNA (guanine(966)-N(2))-methyltransferase RsmD [Bifidobacterium aemilianum]
MHVISGRFKGLPLPAARAGTRPTTERTKEAIFSRLESQGVTAEARVLDLYAGTGALGLEALSRGADALVAVESSDPVAMTLSKTFQALKKQPSWRPDMEARVVRRKAEQFVGSAADGGADSGAFDLIFIDPPYALSTEDCDELLLKLVAGGLAAPDAVIVLERSKRSEPPTLPDGWDIAQRRDYGETTVFYVEAVAAA